VLDRAHRLRLFVLASIAATTSGAAIAAQKTSGLLAEPVAVDQVRLLKGTSETQQWSHYGGSHDEQRFSPLKKINVSNVKDLSLAWYAD
jgi:quinohemoprotein ethanol dehydrogenase